MARFGAPLPLQRSTSLGFAKQLRSAVLANDTSAVVSALASEHEGDGLPAPDSFGQTALHWAALAGNGETLLQTPSLDSRAVLDSSR
jgi:ankyrin repeat protein